MTALHVGMLVGRSVLQCDGPRDRWRIRCHCGAEAWRSARSIRLALAEGRGIHCDACAMQLRRAAGAAQLGRNMRRPRGAALPRSR